MPAPRHTRNHARQDARRAQLAAMHPLSIAARAARSEQALRNVLQRARVNTYALTDGQDATDHLARCVYYIGMGTQIAVDVLGLHDQRTRRLHSALRNVHAMCLDGYRWQYALAPVVEEQLLAALELLLEHCERGMAAEPAADLQRLRVLEHRVQRDDIAGAELYRAAMPSAAAGDAQP